MKKEVVKKKTIDVLAFSKGVSIINKGGWFFMCSEDFSIAFDKYRITSI